MLQATFSQLAWGLGALILGMPLYWLQNKEKISLSTPFASKLSQASIQIDSFMPIAQRHKD
jgi:hypothetical protein